MSNLNAIVKNNKDINTFNINNVEKKSDFYSFYSFAHISQYLFIVFWSSG